MLYEMLAHHSPFYAEGDNLFRLAKKISKGKFAPLPSSYSDKVSSSSAAHSAEQALGCDLLGRSVNVLPFCCDFS